jgi:hypothetical protein
MANRKALDYAPGALPDIRAEGDSVFFQFDVTGLRRPAHLVIRCDADGNILASLPNQPATRRGPRSSR